MICKIYLTLSYLSYFIENNFCYIKLIPFLMSIIIVSLCMCIYVYI